jgi:hypothetical protein
MAIQISGTTVINDTRYLTNTRYQTTLTASTTAVSSQIYVVTSILSTTITLPLNPTAGDWVGISKRTAAAVTIARNGQNIMGFAENMEVDVEDAGFRLVFTGATSGWVIV